MIRRYVRAWLFEAEGVFAEWLCTWAEARMRGR